MESTGTSCAINACSTLARGNVPAKPQFFTAASTARDSFRSPKPRRSREKMWCPSRSSTYGCGMCCFAARKSVPRSKCRVNAASPDCMFVLYSGGSIVLSTCTVLAGRFRGNRGAASCAERLCMIMIASCRAAPAGTTSTASP
eukprot:4366953-Prymnesium_polylepis.1